MIPPAVHTWLNRFDRLSVRERVLILAAVLAVLAALWVQLLIQPLQTHRTQSLATLDQTQQSIAAAADAVAAANANDSALKMARELDADRAQLQTVDRQLYSGTAGLIRPTQMAEVIQELLRHRGDVKLTSLENHAPEPLLSKADSAPAPTDMPSTATDASTAATTTTGSTDSTPADPAKADGTDTPSGPYVHRVTVTLTGRYLDILDYLQALEALPWHFYWQQLDLHSVGYPLSQVRLEICTLSLDPTWLDLGSSP